MLNCHDTIDLKDKVTIIRVASEESKFDPEIGCAAVL